MSNYVYVTYVNSAGKSTRALVKKSRYSGFQSRIRKKGGYVSKVESIYPSSHKKYKVYGETTRQDDFVKKRKTEPDSSPGSLITTGVYKKRKAERDDELPSDRVRQRAVIGPTSYEQVSEDIDSAIDSYNVSKTIGPLGKQEAFMGLQQTKRDIERYREEGYNVEKTSEGYVFYKTSDQIQQDLLSGKVADVKSMYSGSPVGAISYQKAAGSFSFEDPLGIYSTFYGVTGQESKMWETRAKTIMSMEESVERSKKQYFLFHHPLKTSFAYEAATGPAGTIGISIAGGYVVGAGVGALKTAFPLVGTVAEIGLVEHGLSESYKLFEKPLKTGDWELAAKSGVQLGLTLPGAFLGYSYGSRAGMRWAKQFQPKLHLTTYPEEGAFDIQKYREVLGRQIHYGKKIRGVVKYTSVSDVLKSGKTTDIQPSISGKVQSKHKSVSDVLKSGKTTDIQPSISGNVQSDFDIAQYRMWVGKDVVKKDVSIRTGFEPDITSYGGIQLDKTPSVFKEFVGVGKDVSIRTGFEPGFKDYKGMQLKPIKTVDWLDTSIPKEFSLSTPQPKPIVYGSSVNIIDFHRVLITEMFKSIDKTRVYKEYRGDRSPTVRTGFEPDITDYGGLQLDDVSKIVRIWGKETPVSSIKKAEETIKHYFGPEPIPKEFALVPKESSLIIPDKDITTMKFSFDKKKSFVIKQPRGKYKKTIEGYGFIPDYDTHKGGIGLPSDSKKLVLRDPLGTSLTKRMIIPLDEIIKYYLLRKDIYEIPTDLKTKTYFEPDITSYGGTQLDKSLKQTVDWMDKNIPFERSITLYSKQPKPTIFNPSDILDTSKIIDTKKTYITYKGSGKTVKTRTYFEPSYEEYKGTQLRSIKTTDWITKSVPKEYSIIPYEKRFISTSELHRLDEIRNIQKLFEDVGSVKIVRTWKKDTPLHNIKKAEETMKHYFGPEPIPKEFALVTREEGSLMVPSDSPWIIDFNRFISDRLDKIIINKPRGKYKKFIEGTGFLPDYDTHKGGIGLPSESKKMVLRDPLGTSIMQRKVIPLSYTFYLSFEKIIEPYIKSIKKTKTKKPITLKDLHKKWKGDVDKNMFKATSGKSGQTTILLKKPITKTKVVTDVKVKGQDISRYDTKHVTKDVGKSLGTSKAVDALSVFPPIYASLSKSISKDLRDVKSRRVTAVVQDLFSAQIPAQDVSYKMDYRTDTIKIHKPILIEFTEKTTPASSFRYYDNLITTPSTLLYGTSYKKYKEYGYVRKRRQEARGARKRLHPVSLINLEIKTPEVSL